jgi:hypothetical protein
LEPSSKNKLEKSVSELESLTGPPSEEFRRLMIGDWELLCTMNKARVAASSDRGNFFLPEWLKSNPLQEKIRQSLEVIQRIRCMEDGDRIDRVDNVIQFTPISFGSLNLNPLELSQSIVTLAHKAETLSIQPVLRTKISLQSIILTVKGESKFLDPEGVDILGLNVPLGDFLNAGSFDTTYVDDDIRISRGSSGLFDQLRVFLRKDRIQSNNVMEQEESIVTEESPSNYIDMTEETEGSNKSSNTEGNDQSSNTEGNDQSSNTEGSDESINV